MTPERAKELLTATGAIIEGHFVGTSGNHLSVYVAKDRATRLPSVASELCAGIAEMFAALDVDAVVSPAVGAIALSQWTAHHLSRLCHDRPEVFALYSEHEEIVLYDHKDAATLTIYPDFANHDTLQKNDKLILRRSDFVLERGFKNDVKAKRVLVAEDIITTGYSAAKTINAVASAGGIVVGLGVLVNGGNITAGMCNVPILMSLVDIKREVFTEEECAKYGLCARDVSVNTEFGHGKEFLARKK